MKNKILLGIMTFVMALFTVSCSDDDLAINTTPLLTDGSVVTGTADVTPTSAILNGSVKGLESQAASSYSVGFYYGDAADNLSETVAATGTSQFTATITGTPGQTIFYQAFVTLQGRVTYKGSVQSLILTDAKATTGDSSDITPCTATLAGSAEKYTDNSKVGIAISCKADPESVRNGVKYEGEKGDTYSIKALGLLPNTTYYYAAYINLGGGTVYGDVRSFTTASKSYDAEQDFVDLGLSTRWAKCNLGAEKDTELGGLIAFGDLTGYNTSIDPTDYASANIYKTASDVCHKVYGGKATMPTIDEIQELFDCCKVEWTTLNNVAGYKFTSNINGNSIFMPAAGSRSGASITGVGTEGRYMTGSINSDNRYAESFIFTEGGKGRTTTPVYQALSVRAVTVAKSIKLNKSLLYKTWEIDLTDNGEYKTFAGPTYFYGTDDCWGTITNSEPSTGDSWCWAADFAGNSWAVGGDAKNCRGSITFNEDGTCEVKHIAADGTETVENGTYTIDETKKEVSFKGCKVLAPANYTDEYVESLTDGIRILSLSESSLQLMVIRRAEQGGRCGLSINMVPQMEKYGYTASMMCMADWDGWDSATTTVAGGTTGTYTITYNTASQRTNGMVYIIDLQGFGKAYPNAFVRVDAIQADGVDVPFDQNKFCFGDIENNGNFRIELFNIWGNTGKDSPFDQNGGDKSGSGEPALAFSKTFAVTFTVVSLDADLSFTAKQTAVGLDAGWGMPGNWGKENPAAVVVQLNAETHKYEIASPAQVALTLDAATDCNGAGPSNGAVNLVDIVGIRNFFPAFGCELTKVVNDGSDVPFIKENLKYGDIEGNGNFRIELHNIWGSGTAANPAFSGATTVEGNNCVTSLGFTTNSVYTIGNFSKDLFQKPW